MMATNHTTNYSLNQWQATDPVLRTDFNEDNSKIDTALAALNANIQQHTKQMEEFSTQLSKKGNCTIYVTTYEGDGLSTRTLTFPQKPLFVYVYGSRLKGAYFFLNNCPFVMLGGYAAYSDWEGNTLTIRNSPEGSNPPFNYLDDTNYVVALLQADA